MMPIWFLMTAGLATAAEVGVSSPGHAFNPQWSASGEHLAFELNKYEGSIDLFMVNVQNGTPVGAPQEVTIPGAGSSFSSGGSMAAAPNWHPEGYLIFEGSNPGGTNRLYYWQPGGQSAAELLSISQIKGDLSWPAISPSGDQIAFVSDATGNGDLYYWDRKNNQITQAISSPFSEAAPNYASDAARIVYSRKNQGGEDLFVWSGGRSTPLVGGNGDQTRPAFSGQNVVFFSNERGEAHWDVVVSAGTGQKTTIAKDVRLPLRASPSITPDGKWVAYGVDNPEKASAVFFTSLDGTRTVEVETGLVACGEPSVIQVNSRLFLAFTALPSEGADWRQLHILDVTDKVK